MGLFRRITNWRHHPAPHQAVGHPYRKPRRLHGIEAVEPRQMLAADLLLGSVYFEEATGDDTAADVIQVTFQGGGEGSTLNRLIINGDKTNNGLSPGDVFFDVAEGGLGAFASVGLTVRSHEGFEVTGVTVQDGSPQVIFDFFGFEAGELFEFSVDIDEVQFVDPAGIEENSIDTDFIDVNSLVEGAEFQRSQMTGLFAAPQYEDATLEALYWDRFDDNFQEAYAAAGNQLALPDDRYQPGHDFVDRTAGAIAHASQVPLPRLSGTVFHDMNLDNRQDPDMDPGIAGVELALWLFDEEGQRYVDTQFRATTDAAGHYLFEDGGGQKASTSLALTAGTLTIEAIAADDRHNGVEVQIRETPRIPAAFPRVEFDREARSLTIHVSDTALTHFSDIDRQLRGIGFAALSTVPGGLYDPLVEGGATNELQGASRRLLPGTYQVREVQPEGYFSVGARQGTIAGTPVGSVDSPDRISQIVLPPAAESVRNDFAEALPAAISGYVYEDDNNNGRFESAVEAGIAGVQINVIAESTITGFSGMLVAITDATGYWSVAGLVPGEYRVVEGAVPPQYVDGLDAAGTVAGETIGRAINPGDEIVDITLGGGKQGVQYNFGELRLGSIRGRVHLSTDGECDFDDPDQLLEGVRVDLLDGDGNLLESTTTDAQGQYAFEDVELGDYRIREHTPAVVDGRKVFDGGEQVGTVGGTIVANDTIQLTLRPGQHAAGYDFCEHIGASLSGYVYHDQSNDGRFDAGEDPIAGVTLELLDDAGRPTGATAETDAAGYYEFTDLAPGKWGVRELQPPGFLDGLDTPGTHGGKAENPGDQITGAMLGFADVATAYNFGELLAGTIAGRVHASSDGDCHHDDPEILLADVQIDLLDSAGRLLQTTFTDEDGRYEFAGLMPGEYQVVEHQPAEYQGQRLFDGSDHIGDAGGKQDVNDRISGIVIGSGQAARGYYFCEHLGAMLSGYVYHDASNDGIRDKSEDPIAGVTLKLLDADGRDTGLRATTGADGRYQFNDLAPGKYGVMEIQPKGWLDGLDTPGNRGGSADNRPDGDMIQGAMLDFGADGEEYNFGELRPASIAGRVHTTDDFDCGPAHDTGPLAGVIVELLDADGRVMATTRTNASGEYRFEGLRPGSYGVREQQPDGLFDMAAHAGTAGGEVLNPNHIGQVSIRSGDVLRHYDFCEYRPAKISGYVFQDGGVILEDQLPADISTIRDGQRTADDIPIPGVTLELRHGFSGEPFLGSHALPGAYPAEQPIRTVTDASGFYEFTDLPPGNYAVVEVQPEGFVDSLDTAGSAGGFAVNPPVVRDTNPEEPSLGQQSVLERFQLEFGFDAIVMVVLSIAEQSVDNNFSEVVTEPESLFPPLEDPPRVETPLLFPPVWFTNAATPSPLGLSPERIFPIYGGAQGPYYTWHLSVVNAGNPRAEAQIARLADLAQQQRDASAWEDADLNRGAWTLLDRAQAEADDLARFARARRDRLVFGHPDAIPVTGDWNGDGVTELGVYLGGEWFLDLNGNGEWDESDLWASLGTVDDLPVTGDFDGDGKTDIGIFGRAWRGDRRAIAVDPGLPDPANRPNGKWKNVPPDSSEATNGLRALRRTVRGEVRADLIDHVFEYGNQGDIPITGDFNGDGITNIGIFAGGLWWLDTDADGRLTPSDEQVRLGSAGDLPVVGDFNGDGIDELGVFRDGRWHIDTNRDGTLDARDEVFELGQSGDVPVVGDFDGDGVDEPAVYHPDGTHDRMAM